LILFVCIVYTRFGKNQFSKEKEKKERELVDNSEIFSISEHSYLLGAKIIMKYNL
jgi:hypothetical protein